MLWVSIATPEINIGVGAGDVTPSTGAASPEQHAGQEAIPWMI